MVAVLATATLAQPVSAALIMGPTQISATTSIPNNGSGFTIARIYDGITADGPFNGYAPAAGAIGTIGLTLTTPQDLANFMLWNDINVFQEGIKNFRLDFYDPSNVLITSSPVYSGPMSSLPPMTYVFPAVVGNVKRVDLVVLSLNPSSCCGLRLEIREVAFNSGVLTPTIQGSWGRVKSLYR